MSAPTLLASLTRRGVTLSARGDRLVVEASRGTITDEDLRALSPPRAGLTAVLPRPAAPPPPAGRPDGPRGPGLTADPAGADVPSGSWRWRVANWGHARWSAWRARA